MRVRLQFGLPLLLVGVTLICFALAYPRFAVTMVGLLLGVLIVLVCFALLIYFPVIYIAEFISRICRRRRNSKEPEK